MVSGSYPEDPMELFSSQDEAEIYAAARWGENRRHAHKVKILDTAEQAISEEYDRDPAALHTVIKKVRANWRVNGLSHYEVFVTDKPSARHVTAGHPDRPLKDGYRCTVWAKDEQDAIKIAKEQRAEYEAKANLHS
jgi:hypothetical protein